MSYLKLFIKFSLLISLAILWGCAGKQGPAGTTGPAGPALTGDLTGFVNLYDLDGTLLLDHSGVTVSADTNGTAAATAASATNGKWTLVGLKTGTYTITWTKAGYGIQKDVEMHFVGGGEAYYGSIKTLYQIPLFTVTNLAATAAAPMITCTGTLTGALPPSGVSKVRIFVGTTASVSSDPATYIYTKRDADQIVSSGTSLSAAITIATLESSTGVAAGTTVYLIAYAEGFSSMRYTDIITGKDVFPNLNPTPSNVVSVVLP